MGSNLVPGPGITLHLIAVGDVEPDWLYQLAVELPARLHHRIVEIEQRRIDMPPLPAFHGTQYSAQALLNQLRRPPPGQRSTYLLALVDHDLCLSGLNSIFGLAEPPLRRAVVGLPRLREGWYERGEDSHLFRARLLKEAVHELGHTLGVTHCARTTCVMHFSSTIEDTDRKSAYFCAQCAPRLSNA